MSQIRCTYRRWRCYDGTYEHYGNICKHHQYNGFEYDEGCEYGNCEPYRTEDGLMVVPLQCKYVVEEIVMFEKNVKSWTLDNDELSMRGKTIDICNIKELVIDGKSVIGDEVD